MSDLLVAILGGSVASAIALGGRALGVPGEVRANDADADERNESLETWAADRHVALVAESRGIRIRLHAEGQGTAGSLPNALAAARARALHEYRDEARRTRRDVALIRAREGPLHRIWRLFRRKLAPQLTADQRADPLLDAWRNAVIDGPTTPPTAVDDATGRTLDSVIDTLSDDELTHGPRAK